MDRPACRICGEFSDQQNALYHPCRCTGSIKYVHEICLVKWLTIKATGRSGETQIVANLNETKCELCGFNFQFTPVYSPEFSPRNAWMSYSLTIEIFKSLVRRLSQRFVTMFLSLLWTVIAPILIGAVVVKLVLYWNEFPQPFPNLSQATGSIVLYYIVGMFSMVLGFVTLVVITRVREVPQFPRDIRSALLLLVLAALAGSGVTVLPYLTGRSFRRILSNLCTETDFFCAVLDYDSSQLSPISQHLSHISIGLALIMLGGLLGLLFRRLYRAGRSAFVSSLYKFSLNSARTFAYLIVPLTVGYLFTHHILSPDSLKSLSTKLTSFGSLVFHLVVGATVIIPSVVLERFMFSHLVPRPLREEVLNHTSVCHVIFSGRKQREFASPFLPICRESFIRIFVHFLFIFCAILPAKQVLNLVNLLPFTSNVYRETTEKESTVSVSSILPVELFYAHVLVPLAFNIPTAPRWMHRRFDIFCRSVRYTEWLRPLSIRTVCIWVFLRALIVFTGTILMVGLPTIAGRIVFANDDIISYSVGALIVAGVINIVIRVFGAIETSGRPRVGSDVSVTSESTPSASTTQYWPILVSITKILAVIFFAAFLLPVCVGIAFHSTIVSPLRHVISDMNLREFSEENLSTEPKSAWMLIAPIWIVGMMLIKILIALVSVGNTGLFLPSLRARIDAITRTYESNGILSPECIAAVTGASWTVCRALLIHVFLPDLVGIIALFASLISPITRIFVVDFYLATQFVVRVVFPGIAEVISAEKRAVLNQKYLVRTELQNFFSIQDTRVAEEGTPGTPLPSIRVRQLVNT